MNDRFKFRVWDKENKKFTYGDIELNNVEINLSTGLIDRKGNLIYLNDIIVDNYGDAYRVCKCIDDMNYGKIELRAIAYFNTQNSRYISFCEKIGDTYTTPELLE